jgi:hypothetical protein
MAIDHIFVLMLENRSFDHMFAFSKIPGITAATSAKSNTFGGQTYAFGPGAPDRMPSDPSHGFCSVAQQLCGEGTDCNKVSPYPARNASGFVADYSRTTVNKKPLPKAEYGKIMLGIDTASQAPALHALAREYALCDNWFASLPGPTWPNRFFVHGASSDGMCRSPSAADIAKWEILKGFRYPNGSIYDRSPRGGDCAALRSSVTPPATTAIAAAARKTFERYHAGRARRATTACSDAASAAFALSRVAAAAPSCSAPATTPIVASSRAFSARSSSEPASAASTSARSAASSSPASSPST